MGTSAQKYGLQCSHMCYIYAAGSGRHLKQLSFTVPSSAIPGLLGIVSPTTPIPAPSPGIATAPASKSSTGADPQAAAGEQKQPL